VPGGRGGGERLEHLRRVPSAGAKFVHHAAGVGGIAAGEGRIQPSLQFLHGGQYTYTPAPGQSRVCSTEHAFVARLVGSFSMVVTGMGLLRCHSSASSSPALPVVSAPPCQGCGARSCGVWNQRTRGSPGPPRHCAGCDCRGDVHRIGKLVPGRLALNRGGYVAGSFSALLDDIAVLARAAASSVDDVVAGASPASAKATGVVIDDAAVTPQYVHGITPKRELPVVWRITRGSLLNKSVIIAAILPLSIFLPQVLPWLLIVGGSYLAFEGAQKVRHWLASRGTPAADPRDVAQRSSADEDQIVRAAMRTNIVLYTE